MVRELTDRGGLDVPVQLAVLDPSGQPVLSQLASIAHIPPHGAVTVSSSFTPAVSGTYRLFVRVDPEGAIHELREDNNQTVRDVEVASARGLVARLSADQAQYAARVPARLEVVLVNAGDPLEGEARVSVEDASGREVATVDRRAVSLVYGAQHRYTVGWNTGTTYAGEYVFRLRVVDGGEAIRAAAQQPFRIAAEIALSSRLRADRAVVPEGEPASFSARIENLSVNAALADLIARFRVVREGTGDSVLPGDRSLGLLLPGALWQGTFACPAALPSGAYRATLAVIRGGQSLAVAEAPFQVAATAGAFAGTLTLDPSDVLAGDSTQAHVTVANGGREPAVNVPVAVDIRDGAEATVLYSQLLAMDLPPGEARTADVSLVAREPGTYPVLLRVGAPPTTVARATLRVHGPITPPAVDSPADGARVASTHPELRVNNALSAQAVPLAYEFQLFADADLKVALPGVSGIPETAERTSWRVPMMLTEGAPYWWRARATDGFSSSGWTAVSSFVVDARNDPPAAPIPDRPEPGERVGSREPTLSVGNALDPELDPLTYDFRLASDIDLTAIVASVTDIGQRPAFTTWTVPVTLGEGATYYWSARAFDGTSHSPWSVPSSFTVDTIDEPPSMPTPVRPIGGAHVGTLAPELVVRNAVDPEGRPLAYRFEIDRLPTFDSPYLQASPEISQTDDQTAWIPPVPLKDDSPHYWRAAASDGHTLSPWARADFFASLANDAPDAPVPLDPGDLQVVTTSTPTLRVRNAADPEHDALTYEFEVTDQTDAVVAAHAGIPEAPLETTWRVPAPLTENGLFAWRVRATDGEAAGPWSVASRFRVSEVLDPPTSPGLVAPVEDAVLSTSRPTLVVANATSPEGFALTSSFELYRVGEAGELTLIASVAGVAAEERTTSWTPPGDLADGSYSWRSRASDGRQYGPWMPSAHFHVFTDVPPAPPTGLAAVPGDGEVTLTWSASLEPDIAGYRVYRGEIAGGPYVPVASVATPGLTDRGRANGVTVYYVVTALDARFESGYSTEAAATPFARELLAQVRYHPDQVAGECLLGCRSDRDSPDTVRTRDPGDGRGIDDDHREESGGDTGCPAWIYAAAELPSGADPSAIDRATVRLAGAVPADRGYDRIVDTDGDGIRERELRFRFDPLAPMLHPGTNVLSLGGAAGPAAFQGTGGLTVLELAVELWLTPRTLNRRSAGQSVQARLTFRPGVDARDVDTSTLRLNDVVPITRVVATQGSQLTVKFDRDAAAAALPVGAHVQVWVRGTVKGVPFVARDVIRVTE
jgi:hypothetical protein